MPGPIPIFPPPPLPFNACPHDPGSNTSIFGRSALEHCQNCALIERPSGGSHAAVQNGVKIEAGVAQLGLLHLYM
jgi:hypothetical protein